MKPRVSKTTSRSPASAPREIELVWRYVVFPSELGWMAMCGTSERIRQLNFGHSSADAARKSLTLLPRGARRDDLWFDDVVERLQAYARGTRDDFRDVPLDLDALTAFAATVVERCRQIPPGATLTYAALAKAAGRPGAARAVGNIMRTNCVPLIVPCHRVVGQGGKMHGYSGPGGIDTKRRLLEMEVAAWVWEGVAAVAQSG
jgi:methylated-DNA-[protein]-cysteine S-methyltransferase